MDSGRATYTFCIPAEFSAQLWQVEQLETFKRWKAMTRPTLRNLSIQTSQGSTHIIFFRIPQNCVAQHDNSRSIAYSSRGPLRG